MEKFKDEGEDAIQKEIREATEYNESRRHVVPDIAGRDIHMDEVSAERFIVAQVKTEINQEVNKNKYVTPLHTIQDMAWYRFEDLVEKGLLTQAQADNCYRRFCETFGDLYE